MFDSLMLGWSKNILTQYNQLNLDWKSQLVLICMVGIHIPKTQSYVDNGGDLISYDRIHLLIFFLKGNELSLNRKRVTWLMNLQSRTERAANQHLQ